VAFPHDAARRRSLKEFREAVPRRVNELLRERRRADRAVRKVAGDLVVPFDDLPEMMRLYEEGFRSRGLEHAVWGHLSDGNLHPNALPRDAREVQAATEAVLEFADEAVRRGGAPLSEHGVGRDPLKQALLLRFLGPAAVDAMRRVKRALDPRGRFAPGVLFPASGA
jgi:D-lactate dehydrogenase (cytochrome)